MPKENMTICSLPMTGNSLVPIKEPQGGTTFKFTWPQALRYHQSPLAILSGNTVPWW